MHKSSMGPIKWLFQALAYSLSRWPLFRLAPVREELLGQIESTGIRSLALAGAIGILAGTVIIDQSVGMVGAAAEVPVKFGAIGRLCLLSVVATNLRLPRALMPCCFISRLTRSFHTLMPLARSSRQIRGQPYSPLLAACTALM